MNRLSVWAARSLAGMVISLLLATFASAATLRVLVTDNAGRPLSDVVVAATVLNGNPGDAGATGSGAQPMTVIAQESKEFVPYVTAIQAGDSIRFPNRDNILHNVYSFSKAKRFQLPLYKDEPPEPVIFDRPGVVVLGCNIHDWMVAYVQVLETPFFAKTDGNGEAMLANLPAGQYRVGAWHPRRKQSGSSADQTLQLSGDDRQQIEFSIALKPEWRPRRPATQN